MAIAVLIGMHGKASEQLLKTSEMILGQQDNVAYIEFVPGENADNLEQKYRDKLAQLDISSGLIFLVDMWGGSPFNAANKIQQEIEQCDIVTGVNIPMLIEFFMARDDNPTWQELVQIALKSGAEGIKAVKGKLPDAKPKAKVVPKTLETSTDPNAHMTIALARIDDRLIHGQVATRWTKESNINRLIVVNDDVAADEVRRTLLTQVAPPGVTAHVVDVAKAIRVYNNPKYAKDRVILLFTNPSDVLKLVEADVPIKSVNIGGMAFKQGKIQLTDAVSVDDTDRGAFEKLHQLGLELEIRKVPSDSKGNIMNLLKK